MGSEKLDRDLWADAKALAEQAYREIHAVARKVDAAMSWDQFVDYEFIESELAVPDRRDDHLVTWTVTTPDADYPNLKRFDVVTPGYTWHLRRKDEDTDVLAVAVTITLTVGADRQVRLRSGDRVAAATPEGWLALADGVLEPRSVRLGRLAASPVRLMLLLLRVFVLPFVMIWPLVLIAVVLAVVLTRCG